MTSGLQTDNSDELENRDGAMLRRRGAAQCPQRTLPGAAENVVSHLRSESSGPGPVPRAVSRLPVRRPFDICLSSFPEPPFPEGEGGAMTSSQSLP